MIDTHCHLDVAAFDVDRPQVLARAFSNGVTGLVVPAIHPKDWPSLLNLPPTDPRIQVALGIHPLALVQLSPTDDAQQIDTLDRLLASRQAIAVGECGLDKTIVSLGVSWDRQFDMLQAHFALAQKYQLPLILHCRGAHLMLQKFLELHEIPAAGAILHAYSGSREMTPFYIEARCHFSFSGTITFAGARKPLEALRAVPLNRLLLETDSPDQAPAPFRGSRNEPQHLVHVARAVATHLNLSLTDVQALTTRNAQAVFRVF
jgi:TatD DNase family protein